MHKVVLVRHGESTWNAVPTPHVPTAEPKIATPDADTSTNSASTFDDASRQAIIDALKASSGRLAGPGGAAERLGLKRTTLQNKMRRLGIWQAEYSQVTVQRRAAASGDAKG